MEPYRRGPFALARGWVRREVKGRPLWRMRTEQLGNELGKRYFSTILPWSPTLSILLHRGRIQLPEAEVLQPSVGKEDIQPHPVPLHPGHSLSATSLCQPDMKDYRTRKSDGGKWDPSWMLKDEMEVEGAQRNRWEVSFLLCCSPAIFPKHCSWLGKMSFSKNGGLFLHQEKAWIKHLHWFSSIWEGCESLP